METDLPWQFFQAATFVSSGTFKKERPARINKHTQEKYIFQLIFFWWDWRSNVKTASVSFLEGKFPPQIWWPLTEVVPAWVSPSGLLLQMLMSGGTCWGRRCHRWPLWGEWCSRAHRGCNMWGGGICTWHYGTSCMGSTHLLYLRKRQLAGLWLRKADDDHVVASQRSKTAASKLFQSTPSSTPRF